MNEQTVQKQLEIGGENNTLSLKWSNGNAWIALNADLKTLEYTILASDF